MRIVNVKEFDTRGDGISDDTAAIQRAIDAVPRRGGATVVFFPRGRYRLSGTLVVRSGQRLILRGESPAAGGPLPSLEMSDPACDFIDASTWLTDLFTVDGLSFLGAGPGAGREGHGIVLGRVDSAAFDSRITRCRFAAIPGCAIRARHLDGYHIYNNDFTRSGCGIWVEEGAHTVIRDNRFDSNWQSGIYLAAARHFQIKDNDFQSIGPCGTAILTSYRSSDIDVGPNLYNAALRRSA